MKKIITTLLLSAMALFALPNDEVELLLIAKAVEKKAVVLSTMNLNTEKKEAFGELYEHYQMRLLRVSARELALIANYAENYERLSNTKADEIITEAFALEQEKLDLKIRYAAKFKKILNSAEVIRYFQIENRFDILKKASVAKLLPLAVSQ